jgi:hypothetical protein
MRHEIRPAHEGSAHLPNRIGDPGILGNAVINSVGRPMPIRKLAVGDVQAQLPEPGPVLPFLDHDGAGLRDHRFAGLLVHVGGQDDVNIRVLAVNSAG